jgi:hypothetical protein
MVSILFLSSKQDVEIAARQHEVRCKIPLRRTLGDTLESSIDAAWLQSLVRPRIQNSTTPQKNAFLFACILFQCLSPVTSSSPPDKATKDTKSPSLSVSFVSLRGMAWDRVWLPRRHSHDVRFAVLVDPHRFGLALSGSLSKPCFFLSSAEKRRTGLRQAQPERIGGT